jgi:hypothetical protein
VTTTHPVEIGQRYRAVSVPGGSPPVVWEVVAIYMPWENGFEHARLRSVDIRAETMTLASSVVADKARFTRVD